MGRKSFTQEMRELAQQASEGVVRMRLPLHKTL